MIFDAIHLLPSRSKFVRECVDSGNFDTITEVVNEALGLLKLRCENEEVRLCVLRAELQKGFDDYEAGRYIDVSTSEKRAAYIEGVSRRGTAQLAKEGDELSAEIE